MVNTLQTNRTNRIVERDVHVVLHPADFGISVSSQLGFILVRLVVRLTIWMCRCFVNVSTHHTDLYLDFQGLLMLTGSEREWSSGGAPGFLLFSAGYWGRNRKSYCGMVISDFEECAIVSVGQSFVGTIYMTICAGSVVH